MNLKTKQVLGIGLVGFLLIFVLYVVDEGDKLAQQLAREPDEFFLALSIILGLSIAFGVVISAVLGIAHVGWRRVSIAVACLCFIVSFAIGVTDSSRYRFDLEDLAEVIMVGMGLCIGIAVVGGGMNWVVRWIRSGFDEQKEKSD